MSKPMLEIARKYVAAGFSLFPILGKKPVVEWKEYQTRRPNDEELVAWFGNTNYGIGLVTGEISGISVVDVDYKSGGLETLKSLHLPLTWTVKTGGGGWHYYYAYDQRAPQGSGFFQGIDCRNDGGYVVAPPSKHPDTGVQYEWTWKDGDKAMFPIELFKKSEVVKKDWSEVFKGVKSGSRNAMAASVTGKALTIFKYQEWEAIAWPFVKTWNKSNTPPLEESELRAVYESIRKTASKDVTVEVELTQKDIIEKIKKSESQMKTFFTWGSDELDEKFPLIERGTYTVLFGQFSSGKTTFAMFMARMNATRGHAVCFLTLEMTKESLIKQYALKRGGVTKDNYKLGAYDPSIYEKYSDEISTIDYIGIDENNKKTMYSLDDIENIVKERRPDILFIDNFNKLRGMGATEVGIDNETSSRLLFITRTYGVAVVVLHHANKPSKEKKASVLKGIGGMRGTNKINDDADFVVEIGRPSEEQITEYAPNASVMAVYKDRNWDCRGQHKLLFNDGIFSIDNPSEEVKNVAAMFGGKITHNVNE